MTLNATNTRNLKESFLSKRNFFNNVRFLESHPLINHNPMIGENKNEKTGRLLRTGF